MKTTQFLLGVKGYKFTSDRGRGYGVRYDSFYQHQKTAIESAKSLLYGDDVIKRLEKAKTKTEIDLILTTARKNKTREEDLRKDQEIIQQIKERKCQKKKK